MSGSDADGSGQDWRPAAGLDILRLRAQVLATIRAFFAARGVLEVDTPALSSAAVTDPHLDSFVTTYADGTVLYLHPSPELPMKRLLAAGSGCIYQIAKVFRNGEAGRLHNPEFSLLEWYRLGFDRTRLMAEVADLVTQVLGDRLSLQPPEYLSYGALFQRALGLDPYTATVAALADCAATHGVQAPPGLSQDDPNPWLELLLSHCLEPRLGQGRLSFVYDYPATQAALARIRPGQPPVAERFELYCAGIELANGFQELTDATEQRRRFERDNRLRAACRLPFSPVDERFLAALAFGLPACAGVALGLDRLVMLAAGKSCLQDVMSFPLDRT